MAPLEIKPAIEADRKYLIEFFHNLLEYLDEFTHDIPPYRENAEWFVDEVFLPAAMRHEPVLLAWEGEQPVGALFWVIPQGMPPLGPKQAMGYGTYIDPDYRRQGLGKILWQAGLKRLRELEVDVLNGIVYEGNEAAMNFVEGEGIDKSARYIRIDLKKIP